MSRAIFFAKGPSEKKTYLFDFTSQLSSGVTISSATVTATVFSGTDASPQGIVFGSPTIDGQEVEVTVRNGVDGVIYELSCEIATSDNQSLEMSGLVAVLGMLV